ncbi:LPS export ABC transporter permease LptG [Sphingomicrobium lutaoense]|uniref:Lipopolysaccharide export system permease protein n=1 Tax=Sphingomicrobium lutaoense TaxID=515949 RepID=A0A839Z3G6_9SPHN|nr:LPS export ABC transporter permease LptG [Sphingomicrobium lutaoense]MBB3763124.1 lipopolysaccharide export system permease protein [Sphingomicrobium lutaoense]
MINMDFMPSRQLALYMVKLFVTRSLAVLIALVMVLMMLDLLGESGKILAVEGNGEAELWRYVSLRLPLLASRFLPFSVLLGTLIAFTSLNQHSEVISMKAAGLSAHQILAPLIVASVALAGVLFVFNETVVVKSARVVNAWSDNDYHPVPPDSGVMSNVWLRSGDDYVHARLASGRGQNFRLEGLSVYERPEGLLRTITKIEHARPSADGTSWEFEGLTSYDSEMNLVREAQSGRGLAGVKPSQFKLADVDPDSLNIFDLAEDIEALEQAGRPAEAARAGWWHKITGPLSTLLMPLLAAVAAFGLARSGQVLLRATIGMALGFAYFVADNFSLAMGTAGVYPPWLAAWGPFLLFFLIGETVLIRSEE